MLNDSRADLVRALSESNVGSVLMQPEIDKVVAHIVDYQNPIRQNLPRKSGSGNAYYVNRRTPGTTKATFVADTDAITEDTSSYTQVSFVYKTLGAKGKVTRKAQAIGRTYAQILADEIEAKAMDFRDYEDWAIIWGDSASNAKEFDGLHKLCASSQVVAVTTSTSGAALTLAALDEVIDKVVSSPPDMIICSRRTRRKINSLLQAQQRFVDSVEVKGGFKVVSYNEIPIYVSTNIPDTCTFNGTDVTATTGGSTSVLFVLSTQDVFMGVLTEVTVQPLAKVSSQYDEFDIYVDEALVVKNTLGLAKLVGFDPRL